jgi:hypothetical protein
MYSKSRKPVAGSKSDWENASLRASVTVGCTHAWKMQANEKKM